MNDILRTFSPQEMAAAIEQNHEDQLLNLGRSIGAEIHDEPGLKWFITKIPSPIFNVVARTRLSPEVANTKIKAAIKIAKKYKVPLAWWVFPSTSPPDLGERLQSHGLSYKGDSHGAALDLTTINLEQKLPEGLTIQRVTDTESLKSFLQPFTIAHKIPDYSSRALFKGFSRMGLGNDRPYRHYIAWMEGKPVAAHSMLLSAGVAGGYNAVVLPEFRRRGVARAMSLQLSREAYKMNYRFRVGIASDMMWPISKRIGYKEYFKASYYEWDGKGEKRNNTNMLRKILRRVKRLGNLLK